MPVFLSGLLLFHILPRARSSHRLAGLVRRHANAIILVAALMFLSVQFLTIPRLPLIEFPYVPIHVLVSWIFCLVTAVLALSGRNLLVNSPAIWMGRVSFSAYLLHFTAIPAIATLLPTVFNTDATGMAAIGHFALLLSAAIAVTFLASVVTYTAVELPMIGLGKRLCAKLSAARPFMDAGTIGRRAPLTEQSRK
jgi:peptidoglycan/LPS O-acetylase OafA/YrhL